MTKTLITVAMLALATSAASAQMPVPKVGSCPSGYVQSGGSCAPIRRDGPIATPKVGQCPSGFRQSGSYCVEIRSR